jgi:hypothetical protein
MLSLSFDAEIRLKFAGCVALGVIFAVVYSYIAKRRGLRLVEDWARLHGFSIVSVRQPTFVPLWKSGRGWQYFRATLRDRAGIVSERWFRCPTLPLFILSGRVSDSVEVIDDKKSSA